MRFRLRGIGRRVCGGVVLSALVVVPAVAFAAALGGCGGGETLPDLFAVRRSGSVPEAKLAIVVNDGGTVKCNGGASRRITDSQLLEARSVSTGLHDYAGRGLALPPGPQPVLSYAVRTQDGHVSFADDSRGQPAAFYRLALLVRDIAKQDCGLAR